MKRNKYKYLLGMLLWGLVSCIIDDPKPGPIVKHGDASEKNYGPAANIMVDGDFSDWNSLSNDQYSSFTVPDNAFQKGIKVLKACSDPTYLYVYLETTTPDVRILDLYIDSDYSLDEDGNALTGMGGWAFTNDGSDYLLENELFDEDGNPIFDATLFKFIGTAMSGEWSWDETISSGSGFSFNSALKSLPNGNYATEIAIIRALIPGLDDKCSIGAIISNAEWNELGTAPTGPASVSDSGDAEASPIEKLLVVLSNPEGGDSPILNNPIKAAITIDDNLDDWNLLKNDEFYQVSIPENPAYKRLLGMKATYNDDYLFLLIETDGSEEANTGILDIFLDTDCAFDENGLATSGNGTWLFDNDGSELMIDGVMNNYDPEFFKYTGTQLANEWAWTSVLSPGLGGAKGSSWISSSKSDHKFVEIQLLRSAIPNLGNEVYIGLLLQSASWTEIGVLPQKPADSEGEFKSAEKLHIDLSGKTRPNSTSGDNPPDISSKTIVIDGNLSDWDDVTEKTGFVSEAPLGAYYASAQKLKVTADKDYLYLYLEYNNTLKDIPSTLDVFMDIDAQMDKDGISTTGFGSPNFHNDGSDIMIQGSILDGTSAGWSWAEIFSYTGKAMGNDWSWASILTGGQGVTNNSVPVDLGNGRSAFEVSIMRSGVKNMGKEVYLGVVLEANWNTIGIIPIADAKGGEDHVGADMLHVKFPE